MVYNKYLILTGFFILFASLFNFPVQLEASPATETAYNTISYLGGSTNDSIAGLEIQKTGEIVIGVNLSGQDFGTKPLLVDGGGRGLILKLDITGTKVLKSARINNTIEDLDIDPNSDEILVIGDKSVHKFNSFLTSLVWSKTLSQGGSGNLVENGRRISVGIDSKVAVLYSKNISVYDSKGNTISNWFANQSRVNDIALDSINNQIILGGDQQKDQSGYCSGKLKVAYLKSFTYQGQSRWDSYDFSALNANSQGLCADTGIRRIYLARDNNLYIAGFSAGGNTIFNRNPKNISQVANIKKYDLYNDPYNTSSNNIGFYARISPTNGQTIIGQFILARNTSKGNTGNTINLTDIRADSGGNVYLSGESAFKFVDRDNIRVNGQALGAYGGDTFFIHISPQFDFRKKLQLLSKVGGQRKGLVSVRGDTFVFASEIKDSTSEAFTTLNGIQTKKSGLIDTYFSISKRD
jgi:hypothetical protein